MSIRLNKDYSSVDSRSQIWARLERCRNSTLELVDGLEAEDMTVQPIADVSPIKWHLAHTSWFFEELLLAQELKNYQRFDDSFHRLFNSYYKALGPHWAQGDRGSLSRPTVKEVLAFRSHVDEGLRRYFTQQNPSPEVLDLVELGIQHEQQHQELILMDVKYILSRNPSLPKYALRSLRRGERPKTTRTAFQEGLYEIGANGKSFSFDNERPRHKVYLYSFEISDALTTNQEYEEFIGDGGYERPEFWLSLGWDWVQKEKITQPLYWATVEGQAKEFTLHGAIARDLYHPVSHISYFEASAFAKWKGERLPREAELEVFLNQKPWDGERESMHPTDANRVHNQLWNWTQSSYSAYPGFQEFAGPTREYNGKFMCNQYVLRGGCIATSEDHYRTSYRNFFLPEQRWMYSGIRLAKDLA